MSRTPHMPTTGEGEDGEAPRSSPQVVPSIGPGSPSFFPLQTVLEISQSLGQIKSDIAHLTKTVDSVKSDVKDLVKWKSLIIGGAAVIGILFSVIGYLSGKYTFNITEKKPVISQIAAPQGAAEGQPLVSPEPAPAKKSRMPKSRAPAEQ